MAFTVEVSLSVECLDAWPFFDMKLDPTDVLEHLPSVYYPAQGDVILLDVRVSDLPMITMKAPRLEVAACSTQAASITASDAASVARSG